MEYSRGCKKDKIDLRDYTLKRKVSKTFAYPTTYQLQIKRPVKDQHMVSSCVAHAMASILEYHATTYPLSTNFIYGIRRKLYNAIGEGMYLRDACKIAAAYGDMNYTDCPGNDEINGVFEIAEKAFADPEKLKKAGAHIIKSYIKLSAASDIKFALINYGPVLAAVKWYDDFQVDSRGLVTFNHNSGYGGHAIMIYGWNSFGWMCQNSWGSNWGNRGKFILPYTESFTDVYGIVCYKTDDIKKPANNKIADTLYKIVNKVLNIFIK